MDVRQNQKDLKPAQKAAYVGAVLALKNTVDSVLHPGAQSRYDDFVEIHKNAMIPGPAMFMPMPHHQPMFFPWHRVLLRQFELTLQTAAHDPSITIPYWDLGYSSTNNPFTDDFLGGDGDAGQGGQVTTGPFAFAAGHFPIRVWDDPTGDPGLQREFGTDATGRLPSLNDVSAALAKIPYWGGTSCFEKVAEVVLHNPVHNWVGGNMALATSPNDPVFFLHHAYLDFLWERWKTLHPTAAPYMGVPGGLLTSTLVFSAPKQTSPWAGSWTIQQTLDPAALGYGYA